MLNRKGENSKLFGVDRVMSVYLIRRECATYMGQS